MPLCPHCDYAHDNSTTLCPNPDCGLPLDGSAPSVTLAEAVEDDIKSGALRLEDEEFDESETAPPPPPEAFVEEAEEEIPARDDDMTAPDISDTAQHPEGD